MATTKQIAEWVSAEPTAPNAEINCVAAPAQATGNAAVFATSPEALAEAIASAAGIILANTKIAEEATDVRILRVREARLAFSIVADKLKPQRVGGIVHPRCVIDVTARVAPSSDIGAGAMIGANARIGEDCEIGPRVVIEAGVVIGNRVRIQAGAVLGSQGFGYARKPDGSYLLFPQQGALVIEDDVEIGANTTIDRGALGETRIGAGTKIDNLVHIGHNVRIGRNVIIAAQTGISGSSVVEDGAILGGQVGMGERATVGPGVILGGGAGVLSNKKLNGPGQVFWGRPARPLKQYLRDLARLSRGK